VGRLEDKVAIITGATSGIGLACAERFAAEGAGVVLAGRRRDAGEAAARRIGPSAAFVACDVLDPRQIADLMGGALARFGRIDILVNNAGAASATGGILDSDPADLERDLALHVRAPFLAMKHAAPAMIEGGGGAIVNISSISGRQAGFNTFGYEVAKAALAHLTRCAALELGERGVRVNAISPGPTLTGIFGKHVGVAADAAERDTAGVEAAFLRVLPALQAVPGMARAGDIAEAALFLCSDEARFVNGQDLAVDGGILAGRPASAMRASWEVLAREVKAAFATAPQRLRAQAVQP
jgi:NAD(P)-dependent dehydrogenase (short-subunit alcohol dehydrogenase family)